MESRLVAFSVLSVLFQSQVVSAFDAGDAIALVLGLIIGFIMICACLGWYSRRV